jgi:hypothetical protein
MAQHDAFKFYTKYPESMSPQSSRMRERSCITTKVALPSSAKTQKEKVPVLGCATDTVHHGNRMTVLFKGQVGE